MAAAIVVVAALLIAWPWVRVYTGVAPPEQFSSPVSLTVPANGRDVWGVAHNAGSNASTTRKALADGAEVIEIDVTLARGRLVAGRAHGLRWLAERVFRGPTLARAWEYSSTAKIVKLDLQRNDRRLLDSLITFLHQAPPHGRVMISTRDVNAIRYLRSRLPQNITLLFTAPFPEAVSELRTNTALASDIGGISVFEGLVNADLVHWAHARGLLVLAWTVNDGTRTNRLLQDGVDGITTANLAIVQALSH